MNARVLPSSATMLTVRYADRTHGSTLGCIGFPAVSTTQASLVIATGLHRLHGAQHDAAHTTVAKLELIDAQSDDVRTSTDGSLGIRCATTDRYLLAVLELPESDTQPIDVISDEAYRCMSAFNAASGYPHVVRIWNYMDDINQGDGDLERYKQFCVGRARGWARGWTGMNGAFPAASAIGRAQRTGTLLVYWLAAKEPGLSLENPRQVSAFNYPREYGPTSPGFARATLLPAATADKDLLLISGTASIVGYASQHANDVTAQTHETLNNLEALIAHAQQQAPHLPDKLGAGSLLKIYVRDPVFVPTIETVLRERCTDLPPYILLHADICRRELLLEMDCVHGQTPAS